MHYAQRAGVSCQRCYIQGEICKSGAGRHEQIRYFIWCGKFVYVEESGMFSPLFTLTACFKGAHALISRIRTTDNLIHRCTLSAHSPLSYRSDSLDLRRLPPSPFAPQQQHRRLLYMLITLIALWTVAAALLLLYNAIYLTHGF